eukprot:scaffold912_cov119-Cylindrotheca_fusiformis.AAC.11
MEVSTGLEDDDEVDDDVSLKLLDDDAASTRDDDHLPTTRDCLVCVKDEFCYYGVVKWVTSLRRLYFSISSPTVQDVPAPCLGEAFERAWSARERVQVPRT